MLLRRVFIYLLEQVMETPERGKLRTGSSFRFDLYIYVMRGQHPANRI